MQPVDLVLWACNYIRSRIVDVDGLQVGNREPPDYTGDYPLIIITDTGGYATGLAHYRMGLGISVLGWSHQSTQDAHNLARRVYALLTSYTLPADPTNNVASVVSESCMLPTLVAQDMQYARVYCTVEYTVRGSC